MSSLKLPADRAFTLQRAAELGLDPGAVRQLVRKGQCLRLSRAVFVSKDLWFCADDRDRHLMLARMALDAGPAGAVLSHDTAALVHQLQTLEPWEPRPPTLTVTLPRHVRLTPTNRYRLQRAALPASHLLTVDDLLLTSAARTVVDLARSATFTAGVLLADSALRKQLCTVEQLRSTYFRCQDWPGALAAGRAVFFADPLCESPLESVVRAAFHEQGLPPPATQVPFHLGATSYRLDFLWEEMKTVAEADGLSKYTDPAVLREEKLREDRLRDMGFEVVRVTWRDATTEPEKVAARVRAAFDRWRARAA